MSKNKVKSFSFMGGRPKDQKNGIVDIFVTLENDDFEYWVEVATPQALSFSMDKEGKNFLEPAYPYIIVRELTPVIIREALEEFVSDKDDAFWLKLYHLTVELKIDDLNSLLDRYKKQEKQDNEE